MSIAKNSCPNAHLDRSIFERHLELDAFALDGDAPRLDLEDAEVRDDVTFSQQLPVDHGPWRGAHDDALQMQPAGLAGYPVGHRQITFRLLYVFGRPGGRLCLLGWIFPEEPVAFTRTRQNARHACRC